jgi:hypothetical protein
MHGLFSCLIEAARVCIPIGNNEMVVAAVHESPQGLWNDTDITMLLDFINNSILAGDVNV